ncbi:hypothetical protein GCM10011410_31190 [Hoyosella rhizosphaerae]|uniref:Uncharacterized protein n=1 Tax=Hoyosella rhizosphaerae TaxID=1755582 RepID=A0A916XIH1_9ACTN|nr:hypothetical protein GCM10011410_31190 [Hoyosella rhizosphaerae]
MLWRIAALLFLPAAVQILWNLREVQDSLAAQMASDPSTAGQGSESILRTAQLAPWGVMVAGTILMLSLLVCVVMMRRIGSRSARYAIIPLALVFLMVSRLAYELGQTDLAATFGAFDLLPVAQVVAMIAGSVLMFLRPSTEWMYMAQEFWEFDRG